MAHSCDICVEKFNNTNRKKIVCNSCHHSTCRYCIEQYMTHNTTTVHCMSCRVEWNRTYITSVFPNTFVQGTYKKHRENVLLDRERGLLPATQPAAEKVVYIRNTTEQINKLNEEIINIYKDSRHISNSTTYEEHIQLIENKLTL